MHYANVKLPKSKNKYRGGTWFWYNYFKRNNKLHSFDYRKNFEIGTLFLRKYHNIEDQGHVAVFYSKNKNNPDMSLLGDIIHSYVTDEKGNGHVGISNLGQSYFNLPDGYYDYYIEPKDWLF